MSHEYFTPELGIFLEEENRELWLYYQIWPKDAFPVKPEWEPLLAQAILNKDTVSYANGELTIIVRIVPQKELNQRAQAVIDAIEKATFTNRGARELHMRIIERELESTPELLLTQPYYVRLKTDDDKCRVVRARILPI